MNATDSPTDATASPDEIEAALRETLDDWFDGGEVNGEAINHGECDAFAHEVCPTIDGVELADTRDLPAACVIGGKDGFRPEPWHVWLTDGERHYDAEVPGGVERWEDLPFFERTLGV